MVGIPLVALGLLEQTPVEAQLDLPHGCSSVQHGIFPKVGALSVPGEKECGAASGWSPALTLPWMGATGGGVVTACVFPHYRYDSRDGDKAIPYFESCCVQSLYLGVKRYLLSTPCTLPTQPGPARRMPITALALAAESSRPAP